MYSETLLRAEKKVTQRPRNSTLTLCISLIQRLTSFVRSLRKVESLAESPKSSTRARPPLSSAFRTTLCEVGERGKEGRE